MTDNVIVYMHRFTGVSHVDMECVRVSKPWLYERVSVPYSWLAMGMPMCSVCGGHAFGGGEAPAHCSCEGGSFNSGHTLSCVIRDLIAEGEVEVEGTAA